MKKPKPPERLVEKRRGPTFALDLYTEKLSHEEMLAFVARLSTFLESVAHGKADGERITFLVGVPGYDGGIDSFEAVFEKEESDEAYAKRLEDWRIALTDERRALVKHLEKEIKQLDDAHAAQRKKLRERLRSVEREGNVREGVEREGVVDAG